jgi:hypothetical protein
VQHDDYIGISLERGIVTSLLIGAVTSVTVMFDNGKPQLFGYFNGIIFAAVINENYLTAASVRNICNGTP